MHNSPLDNAEFRATFVEANLRYINNCIDNASEDELPRLLELKARMLKEWEEAKQKCTKLRKGE